MSAITIAAATSLKVAARTQHTAAENALNVAQQNVRFAQDQVDKAIATLVDAKIAEAAALEQYVNTGHTYHQALSAQIAAEAAAATEGAG